MYNKSLELQPGYAPALNNLGLVFVAQGKWEEAKDYFNKAIQVDPLLDAAKSNMIKASHMFNITSMSWCLWFVVQFFLPFPRPPVIILCWEMNSQKVVGRS